MRFLLLAITALILSCNSATKKETADRIYYNAIIWTGDSANIHASVIAIKANKILYVGTDATKFKGDSTIAIDANGGMIVPGFIDNHTHFLSGGYNLASVNLRNANSKESFIRTLKEYCLAHPGNSWILGGDWDHEAWGGELPTKEWIDSVSGDHPVFVSRYDGHMALANSKALQIAGVTKNTVVPKGGELVKNKTGEPTGILKDEATGLVFAKVNIPSEKELDEHLQRAIQHAFENGVTQVHDVSSNGGWADLSTYRRAYANNKLDLRIYSFVPFGDWKQLDSFCKINGKGDDMLRWGAVKGFVDGSLGSTTAWFYQPYLDEPTKSGFTVNDTNDIRSLVLNADKAGLHVTVHAIGDRANDFLLRVYREVDSINGKKDRRFRIEHAQHLSADAIKAIAAQQVIPSMQPYHAIDDGKWAYKRLDDDRLKRTYAFKSLLDEGAKLTFGSDWTVAPLSPIEGIYAAVTRRTLDDKNNNGWYPEQKISVEQALRCYTINNAYAGFQENKLGTLKKGMLADFVLLDNDLFKIAPEKIRDIKCLRTIINGKEVYVRK